MSNSDYEITATNINKTVEGAHSAVFGVIRELTKLEEQNQIITKIKVEVETIDGSLKSIETTDICSTNNENDNVIRLYAKFGKVVDEAGNTSRNISYKHITPNDSYKEIYEFMEKYTNMEFIDYIGWMNESEFYVFANDLNNVFIKAFNEPIFDVKNVSPETITDWEIVDIINNTFHKYKLQYQARKVSLASKPYIINKLYD